MAANGMTNVMGSTLLVPALPLPALPDAAAPAPASQQDARVPLPAYGDDYDVSMDLTAELAGIIGVSEEEVRLRAQAWRLEQTFEEGAEQHFGSRLVEYERNMAERTRQDVGVNRAEVTSTLEAVAANNAQLVAQGNAAFEQRDRAPAPDSARGVRRLSCTSLPWRCRRTFPPTLRLASLMFATFSGGTSTRVPAGCNSMPVSTVKCSQQHCARRRIAS